MSDQRLEALTVNEAPAQYGSAVKIKSIGLKNYQFFHGDFELPVDGGNLLVYGENGSGKSTVYNALELLTKTSFDDFGKNLNVFADPDAAVEAAFGFSDGSELIISADLDLAGIQEEVQNRLNGLAVFSPMLDYKKLLKVHYVPDMNGGDLNLYSMFRSLLKDYPVGEGRRLGDIRKVTEYFKELERILKVDLLAEINRYLKDYFGADIELISFETSTEFDDETEKAIPIVNLNIDYKEHPIEKYHTFLNEARLSALAISIYLVTIKKLFGTLKKESLKLLVLDDLLISLDMSNRMKLLEILKSEFADFQIFFFTHDRELFELYRAKLNWKCYELYLDDHEEIPTAILKQGASPLERAKQFYAEKEYEACALFLRKELEKILKSFLTPQEQRDKNCNELDLAGLIDRAKSKSDGDAQEILDKLNTDRKHILNPLSHDDTRNTFSKEIRSALDDVQTLKDLLK